jgi:hypothetical protein
MIRFSSILAALPALALLAAATTAHADTDLDEVHAAGLPDFKPASWVRVSLGASPATLEAETGDDTSGMVSHQLLTTAISGSVAVRPWLAIVAGAAGSAMRHGHQETALGDLTSSFGAPSIGVEAAYSLGRISLGGGARRAFGLHDRYGEPRAADVAASTFVHDPAIAWTQADTTQIHVGGRVDHGRVVVTSDVAYVLYSGGVMTTSKALLRAGAGAAIRLDDGWSVSGDGVVLAGVRDSDHPDLALAGAAVVGGRKQLGAWSGGAALSRVFAPREDSEGSTSWGLTFDVTRAF